MEKIEQLAEQPLLEARIKGERLITVARLILVVPLFLFAVFILARKATEVGFWKALPEPAFLVEFAGIMAGTIYSFWVLGRLNKNRYLKAIKYLSPFIDITLLDIIVFTNAAYPRVSLIFTGAPTLLYFVFLILAAFRNSPSSVAFTGAYITVSYALLSFNALSLLGIFKDNGNVFTNAISQTITVDWDDEVIKPLVFLIATLLLAYLARRFNTMVTDQIKMSIERERLKEVFIDNVKEVSGSLLSSGKTLSSTYREFSTSIAELVSSSHKIGAEASAEHEIIESTAKTVGEMIGSIEAVTGNIKDQAFHVGETASAIAEMEGSIRTITDTSQKASAIAQSLFSAAKDGGTAVAEVYSAIIETERSSHQIEEIVGLITGIAATTDLLSMNAAIEAAHAGDAGRGFAVVADEIRRLAETSGANAKQIGEILKDILARIQNITAMAQQANTKLQSILNDADQTKGINSTIQDAMEEELRTVNEILKSLTSLENITGEVRESSIRQSAGSAGLLSSMAELRRQAETISSLIKGQMTECGAINSLSGTFDTVVKSNDSIVERLEGLVTKL